MTRRITANSFTKTLWKENGLTSSHKPKAMQPTSITAIATDGSLPASLRFEYTLINETNAGRKKATPTRRTKSSIAPSPITISSTPIAIVIRPRTRPPFIITNYLSVYKTIYQIQLSLRRQAHYKQPVILYAMSNIITVRKVPATP